MYIISKCLLGEKGKYNGGDNLTPDVVEFSRSHSFIAVCPECEGGLSVPREPAEVIREDDGSFRVINKIGEDVTDEFTLGAFVTLINVLNESKRREEAIEGAILKVNSPTCGNGTIYDGSFSHVTVPGNGVFAELLLGEFAASVGGRSNLVDGAVFAENFRLVDENGLKDITDNGVDIDD